VRGERVIFRTRAGAHRAATLYCEMFDNAGESQVLAVFQDSRDAEARAEQASSDPGSYRALFLAAAEGLHQGRPMAEIPLMAAIAGRTLMAQR